MSLQYGFHRTLTIVQVFLFIVGLALAITYVYKASTISVEPQPKTAHNPTVNIYRSGQCQNRHSCCFLKIAIAKIAMYQYPKINTEAVKSAIIEDMKNGYLKCLMYLGETEEGLSSVREHILTVSVADSLLKKVSCQIRVEQAYQKFSDDAFPPCNFKNNNPFNCISRKCIFSKLDKRKIDIALLSASGARSLCGIEIKAINQSYKKNKE